MDYSETYIARFWSKIDKSGDCWLWTAALNGNGYGQLGILHDGRKLNIRANRMAYELEVGPIPDGMLVDHICMVRACCNPSHLRLATQKQNMENRPGPNSNSKSGVLGVFYYKRNRNWRAFVTHEGRKFSAGVHASKESAEQAVVALRNELFTHNELDRRVA